MRQIKCSKPMLLSPRMLVAFFFLIVLYSLVDGIQTFIILDSGLTTEWNPLAGYLIEKFGFWSLMAWKALTWILLVIVTFVAIKADKETIGLYIKE